MTPHHLLFRIRPAGPAIRVAYSLHPLFFAAAPVFFLYARNLDNYGPDAIVVALIAVVVLAAVLGGGWFALFRDRACATQMSSMCLIVCFAWGHAREVVHGLHLKTPVGFVGQDKALAVIACVVLLAMAWLCIRHRTPVRRLEPAFFLAGLLAFAIPFAQAVAHTDWRVALWDPPQIHSTVSAPAPTRPGATPSIYYLIIDMFARQDVLLEKFGVDDSAFVSALRARGFYVADSACANYCQTRLSVPSTLNFMLLDSVAARVGDDCGSSLPMHRLVEKNRLFPILRSRGYAIATVAGEYWLTDVRTADLYVGNVAFHDEFATRLAGTTAIPELLRLALGMDLYTLHRKKLLGAVRNVVSLARREGPLFVYAHLICPHPPFVFDSRGNQPDNVRPYTLGEGGIGRDEFRRGYAGQAAFFATQVLGAVDSLLARSPTPPVIILQADHGPSLDLDRENAAASDVRERMGILSAYYLPGVRGALYPTITPVNTFRLLLSEYFGMGLPMEEDRCYFSTWSRPYRFVDVTARARAPRGQ